MAKHVIVTAEAAAPARTERLGGRDHVVLPAVLVREQILNNNLGATFLPADEIEASVEAWNGIDVIVRHPSKRGVPVSARDPEVLNSRGVGRVFRARFDDGALKADIFIDPDRTESVKDAAALMRRVKNGEAAELSTGFATSVEEKAGVHEGTKFEAILRDLRPDHLALLPDQEGACSVTDGCGLARNHSGACDSGTKDKGRLAEALDKITALMAKLTRQPTEGAMNREKALAILADACPLSEERLEAMEDDELAELAESYADAEADGGDGDGDGKGPSAESEDAANEVIAELQEKVTRLEESTAPAVEERERERAEMVKALAANDRVPFESDELDGMSVEQLRKIRAMSRGENYAGQGGPRSAENTDEAYAEPVPYFAKNEEE